MKLLFKNDTGLIEVWNKKEQLGDIYYDKKWKCYVWEQLEGIIMSHDCLLQVLSKIDELDRDKGVVRCKS